MAQLSDGETVELFHLCFVRIFASGKDKLAFPIKDGCNLRFFFGSIRYSEDLELDVDRVERHPLKERVDAVLSGRPLIDTLASRGIEIVAMTTPKQTETTQRWKLGLRLIGRSVQLHTKIEFSRRGARGDKALEALEPTLMRSYKLPPILAVHYLMPTAIRQKVGALVGRSEVQARDIFDLSLLAAKAGGDLSSYQDLKGLVNDAIQRTEAVSFQEFMGQVVAFLVPDQAEPYATEEAWLAMQLQVIDALRTIETGP